ncbi:MAG: YebC/PmpR family DNA-binding transcriptional regulator [Nevskia sp.]|jgi:YebC/PmpR family DNA-binding regulatory protein|nr:YebC/PmpR family DNA-binding transcriptional regulator [Gammaproteobacteria bacterium]MDH4459673.1 YebC/PmpR family DNA-binding transcriptional regulator [Nevskia sp.]
MGRGPSIEGRKNAADAQKAKKFTKFIREITIAARTGGGDPNANPRLRLAIDKALTANMTKDTVERALKRGTGEGATEQVVEIRYEGYGPGGVAVMVDCMTDNATRTVADVRAAFSRNGGNMGTSGSVAFQFTKTGEIIFDIRDNAALEDRIMEIALENGADDVLNEDGFVDVLTTPDAYLAVKGALEAAGLVPIDADVVMRPATRTALDGEAAAQMAKLIARLEELDDVQDVHHNADLPA